MSTPVCEYGRVQRLTLQHEVGGGLTLTLTVYSLDENRIHEVQFSNVRNLRFLGESTELWDKIVLLVADDVSSEQWEDVRFRVKESENEFVEFYCGAIDHLP